MFAPKRPDRVALAASTSGTPVGLDVVLCIGFVKWMAMLAVRLAGHVVGAMLNAVALVIGVVSYRQICSCVIAGIAVQMPDLSSDAASDEVFADESVNEETAVLTISPQPNESIPLLVDERVHNLSGVRISSPTVKNFPGNGPDAPHGRNLVVRIPVDLLPFLHSWHLTGGR